MQWKEIGSKLPGTMEKSFCFVNEQKEILKGWICVVYSFEGKIQGVKFKQEKLSFEMFCSLTLFPTFFKD